MPDPPAERPRRRGGRRRAAEPGTGPSTPLEALGIRAGHPVRFRRRQSGRWAEGVAIAVEKDGSIGVRDGEGRFRALAVAHLEVRVAGGRARGVRWEPLADVAARVEQLELF